jgi:hypothetical protein
MDTGQIVGATYCATAKRFPLDTAATEHITLECEGKGGTNLPFWQALSGVLHVPSLLFFWKGVGNLVLSE